jgi:two-component system sensor histidine kinase YesM
MAEEVRRKEVERVELDRRKKETQLIALQTQMNPHFLYNIFSSVDFLIDLGRQAEASRMLEATGQLFRKGMYRGRLVVPLSEELEHTRAYLAIQDIRHRNRITVSWHVDQSLENTRVPKFILQPLIENSIEHGMEKSKGITIRIYIQRVEDALRIVVEDNGNGIEPAKLRELRRSLEKGEQSEHLGLANVNERVCLHHGVRQPLRVSSTVGKGCHVELTIPRERTADGSDIERGAPNPQSERGVETAHRGR